jgi:pimeloyl-ACP methyl ester carboxylesterase
MSTIGTGAVEIHGHRIAYLVSGDPASGRPVLLLLHGMAGSSSTWRDVIPGLGHRYTVVAPDLPGHGQSDKPRQDYSLGAQANAVRDLLVALGIDHATVVGHSLGGGIAMQLAYQHPSYCERLVLVSSGGLGQEVSWILRALSFPGAEYLLPVLFPGFARRAGDAMGGWLHGVGLRAPAIQEEWAAYRSLGDPEARTAFLRSLRAVIDLTGQTVSAQDRLYLASMIPTLIMWGERDRIIPVAHARQAHDAMPGSRLVVFDDCGHFLHAEEPQRFVESITGFVEATDPVHLAEAQWKALLAAGPPGLIGQGHV